MATTLVYPVFPGITWPFNRSPFHSTLSQESTAGPEMRQANKKGARWKWTLVYEYLFDDYNQPGVTTNWAKQQLEWFFNWCQGSAQSFLYTDPNDNTIITAPMSLGNGNGTQTAFPLFRYKTDNILTPTQIFGVEYLQFVTNLKVYLNGTLQGGGTYTLTQPPSVITFNTAPTSAQNVTYTCQFQFLCKFSQDTLEFSRAWNGLWQCHKLEFQSLIAA